MMRQLKPNTIQKNAKSNERRVRFPGIVRFAREAGVTRIHAYRVLTGERKSPRLTRLWEEFKRKEGP